MTPARKLVHAPPMPPSRVTRSFPRRTPAGHSGTCGLGTLPLGVLKRTALITPFLSTATFAGLSPTSSANSPTLTLSWACSTSMLHHEGHQITDSMSVRKSVICLRGAQRDDHQSQGGAGRQQQEQR